MFCFKPGFTMVNSSAGMIKKVINLFLMLGQSEASVSTVHRAFFILCSTQCKRFIVHCAVCST